MTYKALIFDLDNTIYPVQSIAGELFSSLFQLLAESGEAKESLDAIKSEAQKKPFQWVAKKYRLSDDLTQRAIQLLKELSIKGTIKPFDDYHETRSLPVEKFLVTTGFTKLQHSKVQKMGIEKDFCEIHVVDPETSEKTKKDVFADIMEKHGYQPEEVLVVGDDPDSEIKAAQELGIKAVLYDKANQHQPNGPFQRITHFSELRFFFEEKR